MSTKPSCQIYQIKMGHALCKKQDLVCTPLSILLRDNVPGGLLKEAVPKPEVVVELELNRHIATAPKTPARTKGRPIREGRQWPFHRARQVPPPCYTALEGHLLTNSNINGDYFNEHRVPTPSRRIL